MLQNINDVSARFSKLVEKIQFDKDTTWVQVHKWEPMRLLYNKIVSHF
jgi:hypothetical protein